MLWNNFHRRPSLFCRARRNPKPHFAFGRVTSSHETKFQLLVCSPFAQMHQRTIWSTCSHTDSVNQRDCISYTGIEAHTDLAKQSLHALFKSLPFHDANLVFTLLVIGEKFSLVTLPFKRGNPRYFPKLLVREIPDIAESSCCLLWSTLVEQNILDLSRFTFIPDASQKSCKVFVTI